MLGCAAQPVRQVSVPETSFYLEDLADAVTNAPGLGRRQDRPMRDNEQRLARIATRLHRRLGVLHPLTVGG